MNDSEKKRRDAVIVLLYVLGTLLLLLLTQRREARDALRWNARREGERRDVLVNAAAPWHAPEPGAGFDGYGFDDEPPGGEWRARTPLWSSETEDGFRPLDAGALPEPDWTASRCR